MFIGDILFFKKTDSFISKVIAKVTKSEYSHVGLIVGFDRDNQMITIIESDRFIKTKVTKIKISDYHAIYTSGNLSNEVRERIVKYAFKKIGTRYDYMQILGLLLSLLFDKERNGFFNSANKIICSELIDISYYEAGVKRNHPYNLGNVTPQELIDFYGLKEIEREVYINVY